MTVSFPRIARIETDTSSSNIMVNSGEITTYLEVLPAPPVHPINLISTSGVS